MHTLVQVSFRVRLHRVRVGGPPHSSRQEFLCSIRSVPHRIGEEKHPTCTVNLPILDKVHFAPLAHQYFQTKYWIF